jgi:integrase
MTTAEELQRFLKVIASAKTEKGLLAAQDAVNVMAAGGTTRLRAVQTPTFEDFAKSWTSGALHREFPDHVRAKDPTRDTEVLKLYINPLIGDTRVADVSLEDAERVMSALPSKLSPRTRRLIAQCLRRILSLAVYPGRLLASNPIPREWMPKVPKSANKAKGFLYPEEDAKLLGCLEVPLIRRLAYGVLAREGMRASELEALRWRDVDLTIGLVRLDENKTDDPRAWALSPDVARTLAWWKNEIGGSADERVLDLDLGDGAWWLRGDEKDPDKNPGDLRKAGIRRPELFERTASRQPIRLHDLRATFCTISLAAGKTEQWVTDRTGHRSSQQLAQYVRQARTWAELGLGSLGPLDALLPEVSHRTEAAGLPGAPLGASTSCPLDIDWTSIGATLGIRTPDLRFTNPRLELRALPDSPREMARSARHARTRRDVTPPNRRSFWVTGG